MINLIIYLHACAIWVWWTLSNMGGVKKNVGNQLTGWWLRYLRSLILFFIIFSVEGHSWLVLVFGIREVINKIMVSWNQKGLFWACHPKCLLYQLNSSRSFNTSQTLNLLLFWKEITFLIYFSHHTDFVFRFVSLSFNLTYTRCIW